MLVLVEQILEEAVAPILPMNIYLGAHRTEVALALLTQRPRVPIPFLLEPI